MKTMPVVRKALCLATGILLACLWAAAAAGEGLAVKQAAGPSQDIGASTSEVLVFLSAGTDVESYAREHGLTLRYALRSDADACVFDAGSAQAARGLVSGAGSDARVRAAWLNAAGPVTTMAFVPNDPFFHKDTPSPGWHGQWNLKNEYTSGLDARVAGAWNRNVTGAGVVVGIIDTGIETVHPDLFPNYDAADSWDFGQNDPFPDPVVADDDHGTAVAGLVAARGGNGIGITGAAPYASLAGLRCDFWSPTPNTAQFVDATLYHSSGANTNIKVKNHSYGYPAWYATPADQAALETSTLAGTIHVFSAGNSGNDTNKRDLQNSWGAVTVAALGSDGTFAPYSDFGADIFVTAMSDSVLGFDGVLSTDRLLLNGYNPKDGDTFPDNNYTSIFGGTSAAAPVVAGVMALGKSVQPNLDTRLAKHLLVLSSTIVDPTDSTIESDGGWKTNAAGFKFNQNYGFGLIDADCFTLLATYFPGVTPLVTETTGTVAVNQDIPDDCLTGVSRTFNLNSVIPLEEVLVTLHIAHTYHGDLEAYLTSPGGTTGRLFISDLGDQGDNIDWTFLTNVFWGERPAGTWTLKVDDTFTEDTGTWQSFSVEARMGELVPEPGTMGLLLLGGGLLAGRRRRRK